MPGGHGFGNVGLGIGGDPPKDYPRPDLCAANGHPGNCFNPGMNQTVCACGQVWRPGNQHAACVTCCGGILNSPTPRPADWEYPIGKWCPVPVREAVQLDLFGAAA